MAKDLFFSRDVCEQLARELVTEQAELLKHEALVKTMKAKIIEGKEQLINSLIGGKTFKARGGKRTALEITYYEEPDALMVVVTFGRNPEDVVKGVRLTRREKALIEDYDWLRSGCANGFSDGDGIDAISTAEKLQTLKNHIYLVYPCVWKIDLRNPVSSDFFKKSGLDFEKDGKGLMLEDLVC